MSVMRLTDIEIDSELQPRAEIDAGVLLEYGQRLADGVRFPPVVVFRDAKMENNWLTDGFHRWYAHKAVGLDTIEVRIIEGSRRDALLYSLSANSKHGLQRGVLDYRRAYEIAVSNDLVDPTDTEAVARLLRCTRRWASELTERARVAAKAKMKADIIRLRDEGKSVREVVRETGASHGTVQRASGVPKGKISDLVQDDPPPEFLTERAKESPRELNSLAAQNWSAARRALRHINEQVSVDELFDHYIGFDPEFGEELKAAHQWINEFWESYIEQDH